MDRVLANRLQLVSNWVGLKQNYAAKGSSIQDNLHLVRGILEGIEDDTEAALISLDQSKAFDRVDYRFLAAVLETAGFKPESYRWISILYHSPQAVVQVNGKRLEPLRRRLRDEAANPALIEVLLNGRVRARVSAFTDDMTVFVSRWSENLGKPMIEHICQNRDKYGRYPQIHFVEKTIQSRQLVEPYILQHIIDFTLRNPPPRSQPLPPPEGGGIRLSSCETPVSRDQANRKNDPENAPETFHLCHGSTGARVHLGTWRTRYTDKGTFETLPREQTRYASRLRWELYLT